VSVSDRAESAHQFQRYRVGSTESPSETVVRAVSSATGQDPANMPFLYESVDPDALNQLMDRPGADGSESLCVSFQYAGYYVAAEHDRILIRPISEE
jgi:hypothetical protein